MPHVIFNIVFEFAFVAHLSYLEYVLI